MLKGAIAAIVAGLSLLQMPARVSAEVWEPTADTILLGASIVTMGRTPMARALAIKDGKIIGVGDEAEVLGLRGPRTRVIELRGRTIIPGLQDSHTQPIEPGRELVMTADLSDASSSGDIVSGLQALKDRLNPPAGQWIQGSRWDGSKFKTLFTRWDVDRVTPDNPAWLTRYRSVAINSAALRLMGIRDEDSSTWPAWWLKDPADFTGEDRIYRAPRTLTIDGFRKTVMVPTGVFIGTKAMQLVTVRPPKPTFEDDIVSAGLSSDEYVKLGITSIVNPANSMGYNVRVVQAARERGLVAVKQPNSYEGVFFNQTPEELERYFSVLKPANLGNAYIGRRGVKFYADGGPTARGSWVQKPYVPLKPGDPAEFGVPVETDDAKREAQFRVTASYGWNLHTHATGDAAILQTLRLYKKLIDEARLKDPDFRPRWTVEHVNLVLEAPEALDIMARYGIVASVQPIHLAALGGGWLANLDDGRLDRSIPVSSLMKRGIVVVSGSDFPVATFDPWLGMYAMVTRKDLSSGRVYGADERVSLMDALKTYTINGAYVTYEEAQKGSLELGKVADLVVLDIADFSELERTPERLRTMKEQVLATVVDGIVRYRKPGFTSLD